MLAVSNNDDDAPFNMNAADLFPDRLSSHRNMGPADKFTLLFRPWNFLRR